MFDIDILETPSLGNRSYLVSDGEVALVIDPPRDIDRVLSAAGHRGARIALVVSTHSHNDMISGETELARLTGAAAGEPRRRRRAVRPPRRPGRRRAHRGHDAPAGAAHPRPHPHHVAYALQDAERPDAGGVHRRQPAVRRDRPHRPRRSRAHRHPDPRAVPLGPPPGRRAAGRHRHLPDPRLRQLLRRHPDLGRRLHHRRAADDQPGAHPGRADLRRHPARRPGRLPRLLPAHEPGEPARTGAGRPERPRARRRRRAAPPHRRRRVGRRPARPHRLRRRPRRRQPRLRAGHQLRHLPRLDHPVGHTADPDR